MEDFDETVVNQIRELASFLRENPWDDVDLFRRLRPLFIYWASGLLGIEVPQGSSGPSSSIIR
jgi:hypothetical protein